VGIVALIFTIVALVVVIASSKKGERIMNPLIIFLGLWSLVLFLSILRPFGIDPASNQAYLLLLIMISSFLLGFAGLNFIRKKKPEAKKNEVEELPSIKDSLALKILVGIAILGIILNVIDWLIGLHYILEGAPAWQVRNWTLQPFGSDNPILSRRPFIEEIFRVAIVAPISTLVTPLAAYFFFASKNKSTRLTLLVIAIINTITSSLAGGGGRLGYVLFAFFFVIAYLVLKSESCLHNFERVSCKF